MAEPPPRPVAEPPAAEPRPVPVIGGTLLAQGPPPPTPTAVSVAPQVEAYDELTYRCKPDDTFAKVSQQFFQSDRYARALQMHNRGHPQATEGVLHDPPQLDGQKVFIPPLRILEKNYGSLIPDFKPLPAMAPPPLTPGGASAVAGRSGGRTSSRSGRRPCSDSAGPGVCFRTARSAFRTEHASRHGADARPGRRCAAGAAGRSDSFDSCVARSAGSGRRSGRARAGRRHVDVVAGQ